MLTDGPDFGGSLDDLARVRAARRYSLAAQGLHARSRADRRGARGRRGLGAPDRGAARHRHARPVSCRASRAAARTRSSRCTTSTRRASPSPREPSASASTTATCARSTTDLATFARVRQADPGGRPLHRRVRGAQPGRRHAPRPRGRRRGPRRRGADARAVPRQTPCAAMVAAGARRDALVIVKVCGVRTAGDRRGGDRRRRRLDRPHVRSEEPALGRRRGGAGGDARPSAAARTWSASSSSPAPPSATTAASRYRLAARPGARRLRPRRWSPPALFQSFLSSTWTTGRRRAPSTGPPDTLVMLDGMPEQGALPGGTGPPRAPGLGGRRRRVTAGSCSPGGSVRTTSATAIADGPSRRCRRVEPAGARAPARRIPSWCARFVLGSREPPRRTLEVEPR